MLKSPNVPNHNSCVLFNAKQPMCFLLLDASIESSSVLQRANVTQQSCTLVVRHP